MGIMKVSILSSFVSPCRAKSKELTQPRTMMSPSPSSSSNDLKLPSFLNAFCSKEFCGLWVNWASVDEMSRRKGKKGKG